MRSPTNAQPLRRAAASFNKALEPTGMGRFSFLIMVIQRLIPWLSPAYLPVAQLGRSPTLSLL